MGPRTNGQRKKTCLELIYLAKLLVAPLSGLIYPGPICPEAFVPVRICPGFIFPGARLSWCPGIFPGARMSMQQRRSTTIE